MTGYDDARARPDGEPVVVVTAFPLSREARADLSAMLGEGYAVMDIKTAPLSAEIVLTPVISVQLMGGLRMMFPRARILFTELQDEGRGISQMGPLSRIVDRAPDGYFIAHELESLAPVVQAEARLALTGGRRSSGPQVLGSASRPVPDPAADLAAHPFTDQHDAAPGSVVWVHDETAVPPGARWLDRAAVDALVTAVTGTPEPRHDPLWPAVAAECAVRLAPESPDGLLVAVGDLEPTIRAELQVRVASDGVPHRSWQDARRHDAHAHDSAG